MSARRACVDCCRQVRLPTSMQPPRCIACRLAGLSALIDTRPCFRCQVLIPANSSDPCCRDCQARRPSDISCRDCGNPFPATCRLIRCPDCRSRRTAALRARVAPVRSQITRFDPFINSFNQPSRPGRGRPRARSQFSAPRHLFLLPTRPQPTQSDNVSFLDRAVGFLRQEHESRVHASQIFPPQVSESHIRLSVARFETIMGLARQDLPCASCGRLIPSTDARQVIEGDSLLKPLEGFLDCCGYKDGFCTLCSACYAALLRGSVPRFSAKNNINVTLCQHYPDALKDLSLTEESLIAASHPVGVVVKLRPGGQTSPSTYRALRGHFIIIPQDPKPLLRILPSPGLELTEVIKVFWLGNRPPTDDDLRPFLIVRKHRVLTALQHLVQSNPLYGDVTINHSTLDQWLDDFIPSDLQQQVICLDETDHHERAGYSVNLQEGNYENEWQAAEGNNDQFSEDALPVTGSVTTDINGERQNPDVRLLNTVYTLVKDSVPEVRSQYTATTRIDHTDPISRSPHYSPVVEYGIRGQPTLLNHWQDPHYFTSAFPTLFPGGIGRPSGSPYSTCFTRCFC